jgi:hypothetical protein
MSGMETSESDIGYPEEQPPEVDDTPGRGKPQQGGSDPGQRRRPETDNDDGRATGNPPSDDD